MYVTCSHIVYNKELLGMIKVTSEMERRVTVLHVAVVIINDAFN